MTKKSISNSSAFPNSLIKHWEKSDGINFAIALSRITGWILQIDLLTPHENAPLDELIPLRAYVETNEDIIYDFTGKRGIIAFNRYVVMPIAVQRATNGKEHICTRCYEEIGLTEVKLRERPSEIEIERATKAIIANSAFLEMIPKRLNPEIPAYHAVKFSQGNCIPFAEALSSITGLSAFGLSVTKYRPECGNPLGFCHVVLMHADGTVEDSWGRQDLEQVLKRFYILEFELEKEIYSYHRERQLREYPDRYQQAYDLAIKLLKDSVAIS